MPESTVLQYALQCVSMSPLLFCEWMCVAFAVCFFFDDAAIACFCLLCYLASCVMCLPVCINSLCSREISSRGRMLKNGEIYPCECMNCYILLPEYCCASNCDSLINVRRYLLKIYSWKLQQLLVSLFTFSAVFYIFLWLLQLVAVQTFFLLTQNNNWSKN